MFMSREEGAPGAQVITEQECSTPTELHQQSGSSNGSLWRQTVVIRNSQGREEAFTIGPNGTVWNFFPDEVGTQSYQLVNLELPAERLVVAKDSMGRMIVFASKGLQLRYRVEVPRCAARWSPRQRAVLPVFAGAFKIKRLHCEQIAGKLLVGAVVGCEAADGAPSTQLAFSAWSVDGPVFQDANHLAVSRANEVLQGFSRNVFDPARHSGHGGVH